VLPPVPIELGRIDRTEPAARVPAREHAGGRQQLGRTLGFRTLNLRFPHPRPAAMGIFVVQVRGLADEPVPGVASLGVRPTVDDSGRVLLETHCLAWPEGLGLDAGYGRCLRVELLAKLHDERRYPSLEALREGIARDRDDALAWFAARGLTAPR
jgi:riboflavin kinase/FMN adenylyltransferase